MKKDTTELENELKTEATWDAFHAKNREEITAVDLPTFLAEMLRQKGLEKGEVIRRSTLSPTYAYHIFSGTKPPSREKLLALALAMHMDADEVRHLLHAAGLPQLYARKVWDSILLHAIEHGKGVLETNDLLEAAGEPLLG